MLIRLDVVLAALAQTGVRGAAARPRGRAQAGLGDGLHADVLRVVHAQGERVAAQQQLHGVAHRGVFDQRDLRAGNYAHIQKVLAQRALAADLRDDGGLAD